MHGKAEPGLTSGVLQRVGHGEVSLEAGGDSQPTPGGGGHQFGEVPCQERHSRVRSGLVDLEIEISSYDHQVTILIIKFMLQSLN